MKTPPSMKCNKKSGKLGNRQFSDQRPTHKLSDQLNYERIYQSLTDSSLINKVGINYSGVSQRLALNQSGAQVADHEQRDSTRKVAGTLRERGRKVARTLRERCRKVAGTLRERCRKVAGMLQQHSPAMFN
ncbi:hypothetical protein PV325_012022, partial [Microctonus aethiopoides]